MCERAREREGGRGREREREGRGRESCQAVQNKAKKILLPGLVKKFACPVTSKVWH